MKSGMGYKWLIIFISAALFICTFQIVSDEQAVSVKIDTEQQKAEFRTSKTQDVKNKQAIDDSLKVKKIKRAGPGIPRNKGSVTTEVHRPSGPDKPEGAGKKHGAAKKPEKNPK